MKKEDSNLYIFNTHVEAESAIRSLSASGFDVKKLSLVGKGYHSEEHPVGFYTANDRIKTWGGIGAFWGGFWGLLLAPAVFFLPGIGLVAMAGPVVAMLVGALEGAVVVGGLSALGGVLTQIGLPKDQVIKYESALKALGPWRRLVAWDSSHPYLYLRTTGDARLLVGGEDDSIDIPAKRDAKVQMKAGKLLRRASKILPQVNLEPTFSWAGTFAETADGLPFFGPHQQHGPRVLFAMAYGGNGITYSAIGAGLIAAQIRRKRHPLAGLFSFKRLER